jgi:hypothetical protein
MKQDTIELEGVVSDVLPNVSPVEESPTVTKTSCEPAEIRGQG